MLSMYQVYIIDIAHLHTRGDLMAPLYSNPLNLVADFAVLEMLAAIG